MLVLLPGNAGEDYGSLLFVLVCVSADNSIIKDAKMVFALTTMEQQPNDHEMWIINAEEELFLNLAGFSLLLRSVFYSIMSCLTAV